MENAVNLSKSFVTLIIALTKGIPYDKMFVWTRRGEGCGGIEAAVTVDIQDPRLHNQKAFFNIVTVDRMYSQRV
jgi:hypothetical protein